MRRLVITRNNKTHRKAQFRVLQSQVIIRVVISFEGLWRVPQRHLRDYVIRAYMEILANTCDI